MTETATAAISSSADATRLAEANTLLTPRFYKTNYDEIAKLNVASVRDEWDQMMA